MDLGLEGHLVVVTGASGGIGGATAMCLAREGCDIIATGRNAAALDALAERIDTECGRRCAPVIADLATDGGRALVARHAANAYALVNLAGSIPSGELDELDDAAWRAGWKLKLFGYIHLARRYYTAMKARRSGVIVNVIGMAGVRLDASNIAGSTANAALIAFTRALGARSVDFGIRVLGVNPALTATERATNVLRHRAAAGTGDPERWPEYVTGLPFGRMASPEEVADAIAFLLSPLRAAYLSGSILNVDAGLAGRP